MTIEMERNDKCLTVTLEGRLDTLTSPELEQKLEDELEGTERIVFDLEKLEYISSAGLRVLVGVSQDMDEEDGMVLKNPSEAVKDVLEVTGLIDSFVIEE